MPRNNKKVVPESRQALEQMKYEIATELGLVIPSAANGATDAEFAGELGSVGGSAAGYVPWEQVATREAGSVGGQITRRLIQQAEQVLGGIR
ncbi:small, acid-soluble spore protein, alpha/beta type [Paenibacillus tarimensis]